jgi:hypothetical protein
MKTHLLRLVLVLGTLASLVSAQRHVQVWVNPSSEIVSSEIGTRFDGLQIPERLRDDRYGEPELLISFQNQDKTTWQGSIGVKEWMKDLLFHATPGRGLELSMPVLKEIMSGKRKVTDYKVVELLSTLREFISKEREDVSKAMAAGTANIGLMSPGQYVQKMVDLNLDLDDINSIPSTNNAYGLYVFKNKNLLYFVMDRVECLKMLL